MKQSLQVLEWMAEGEVKGRLEALILVLKRRFGSLPADLEDSLRACSDVAQLNSWIVESAGVDSLDAFRRATGQ